MNEIFQALIAYGLVAVPAFAVCGLWWVLAGPATFRLLPIQRRRKSWWTGWEVLLAFFVFEMASALSTILIDSIGFFDRLYTDQERKNRAFLWVVLLSTPVFLAVVLSSLYSLSQTRPSHLGLTRSRLFQNVVLATLTFLAATPVIFAINYAVSVFMPAERHPIERMLDDHIRLIEWGLIIFAAVIAAPIVEELLFRGVLFRWLVRASWGGHVTVALFSALISVTPTLSEGVKNEYLFLGPVLWIGFLIPFYLLAVIRFNRTITLSVPHPALASAPESAPTEDDAEYDESDEPQSEDQIAGPIIATQVHNPIAAILGSSILFAAFHASVWPTPVPLFFMGLPLAWLAYRTQSLVASIVFHALFNSVSIVIMLLSALTG